MLWTYSHKHEGEISRLLKELVIAVNKNMEMIIDDRLEMMSRLLESTKGKTPTQQVKLIATELDKFDTYKSAVIQLLAREYLTTILVWLRLSLGLLKCLIVLMMR